MTAHRRLAALLAAAAIIAGGASILAQYLGGHRAGIALIPVLGVAGFLAGRGLAEREARNGRRP